MAERRYEVDGLDERSASVLQHHDNLSTRRCNLWSTSGPRQSDLRDPVVTDHSAVDVSKSVDLGGANDADIDSSWL
ncbi:MAG TPA: hypothetical protein VNJ28_02365 [Candidatus Limnocylindrales bacterium]|nr:hypothetical protein [Candidatus Limnocylindrales bacterium]